MTNSVFRPNGTTLIFQRPAARLSPCRKTNPGSRARQEADVKPRFLTGAAPNLALLFADDAATEESILPRKRGIVIFAVTSSNLFRSAPLGLFVPDIPKPRALPWADLWLARWAGTQTELHSNARYWAASNFSDTHTAVDSITTVIHRAILSQSPEKILTSRSWDCWAGLSEGLCSLLESPHDAAGRPRVSPPRFTPASLFRVH